MRFLVPGGIPQTGLPLWCGLRLSAALVLCPGAQGSTRERPPCQEALLWRGPTAYLETATSFQGS